jgi:uncharacterized membrane protein
MLASGWQGLNVAARLRLRWTAVIIAVASPALSHIALTLGQGYDTALALAAAQAVATGTILATSLPQRRWIGPLVALILLTALCLGARHSPQAALLAMAGTAHALLYSALLIVFASTLRPGRTALVTWLASRLNPTFHPGMVPYTRKVTLAWVLLFATQLLLSAALLATDPPLWQTFVTILHIPLTILMALAEAVTRRYRWRHEHSTSLADTIRGTRRMLQRKPPKQ